MADTIRAAVKKLIRNRKTQAFLTTEGEWTSIVNEAWQFKDFGEAASAKLRFNLQDVELYFAFDDYRATQWDIALTL